MKKNKFRTYAFVVFFMMMVSVYLSSIFQFYMVNKSISYNPIEHINVMLEHGFPWQIALVVFLIMFFVFLYFRFVSSKSFVKDERNFNYSNSGVYGTAALLSDKDIEGYALVQTPRKAEGVILGQLDESGTKIINTDMNSRMNKHVAVFGASGSGKSRGYARPFIIQCVKRRESVIVTDPKGELYESTAQYLKDNGYIVRVFDLVHPERSDGWDCLKEIHGDEIRAQIFSNVVIENTSNGKSDPFWDNASMSLLKALLLRVDRGHDYKQKHNQHIGTAYDLIQNPEGEDYLDRIFDAKKLNREESVCMGPYMTFKQGSDNMRGNIITGLATKLQVFQNDIIKKITSVDDIDLTLPAQKPCAYFCIMSDQHSTLNFLSTLLFSFCFIDQVEYADLQPNKKCKVPVNYLLDEFPNIGSIPDFDKKVATVRSRDINISIIFQNIGQLQNKYPNNVWASILANCDTHLMLGCNDEETAKFISNRSGDTTVKVQTLQHPKYEPFFTLNHKHSSGDGKRKILNPDEVRRLPINEVIIIFRGLNVWRVNKYDFELHPEAKKFRNISILDKPTIYDEEGRREYKKQDEEYLKKWKEKHAKNKKKTEETSHSYVYSKKIKEGADIELDNDLYSEFEDVAVTVDDLEIVDTPEKAEKENDLEEMDMPQKNKSIGKKEADHMVDVFTEKHIPPKNKYAKKG